MEKTYRYDEGGTKVLVYEVDRTGQLIVHDPTDKRAQQMMSGRKAEQKAEAEQAARMDKIKLAPKRKPSDPIFVNLKPIDDRAVQLTEKQKKDVHDYLRKHLENDRIIRLDFEEKPEQATDRKGVRRNARNAVKDLGAKKNNADVDVAIKVIYEMGIGGHNGKLKEVKNLGFHATIKNNWMRDTYEAKGGCSLLDIPNGTQRFTDKVKQVIRTDVGPNIPADRSL